MTAFLAKAAFWWVVIEAVVIDLLIGAAKVIPLVAPDWWRRNIVDDDPYDAPDWWHGRKDEAGR